MLADSDEFLGLLQAAVKKANDKAMPQEKGKFRLFNIFFVSLFFANLRICENYF